MEKNLYIDASHPNETRIVLKSNSSIEEYEVEDKNNLNFKNNIYLATISRVEPSLQAAFVNFGRERHGFLAFNDIQSDYYQLPSEDKEKIRIAEEKIREELKDKIIESNQDTSQSDNQLDNLDNKDEKNDNAENQLEKGNNKQVLKSQIPLGRIGLPKDIGGAAFFLSSEEAEYITGQMLYIDGGILANQMNWDETLL